MELEHRARPSSLHSQKAPRGALASNSYYAKGQPVWPTYDSGAAITRGYERTMYAARCIDHIANNIAGLPFLVGNVASKSPRRTAPLAQLLGPPPGGPNAIWSAANFWRYSIAQYLTMGKFAWLHERDASGRIVGLWPLQAQHLVPLMADPGSTKPSYFSGYRYGHPGTQGYQNFKLEDVTYCWRPSLSDYRQPESPVMLASMEINISALIAQYDTAFLSNGGVPAHLITTGTWDSPAERKAFRDQFAKKFGGARNANKVMFAERELEPGEVGTANMDPVQVHTLGQSQRDSEMQVLRDSKIQDICVAFGVPLSLLGDSTRAKFTNMETDRKNFWEGTRFKMRELEDMVNRSLGATLGSDVGWFDVQHIAELRSTPRFTETEGPELVTAGLITVDEWREDRGLPPLPEQDKAEPVPAPEPEIEDTPAPQSKSENESFGAEVVAVRATAQRTSLLDVLRGQLDTLFADQQREVTLRAEGKRGGRRAAEAAEDISNAFDLGYWETRSAELLAPTLRALGMTEREVTGYVENVTAEVFEHLAHVGLEGAWVVDNALRLADTPATVPLDDVALALAKLAEQA